MKFKKPLLIIAILLVSLLSCKKDKVKESSNITLKTYQVTQGKHCFKSIMEQPVIKGKDTITGSDYLIVEVTILNNEVTGIYNYVSKSNPENNGTFIGTIKNNIITAIHTYNSTSKKSKQELVFKIEEKQISLLGGEKINKNGISVFKDKSKGVYMISIPRISCK